MGSTAGHPQPLRPVTVQTAAQRARVTTRTVRRWIATGRLTPLPNPLDRRTWVDLDDVYDAKHDATLANSATKPRTTPRGAPH